MKGTLRKTASLLMAALMAAGPALSASGFVMPVAAADPVAEDNVIRAVDFGADPSGVQDSTEAIIDALAAAREQREKTGQPVRLEFARGEYQIYKDRASRREVHTSNTNSIDYPEKTIGLLIEDQQDLTIEGNGSMFMMHGNMMALAVIRSKNITLQNFSWDFETPTTTEMTIVGMSQEGGKDVTEFYIPKCFPYEISGTTISWTSEPSPYTGRPYWSAQGIHNTYSVSAKSPLAQYTRRYNTTTDSPFYNVQSIAPVEGSDGTRVKVTYRSSRPSMQKMGMIFELNAAAVRETAGAMIWESENVTSRKINVHYMHGFGWLLQMAKDAFFYDCAIEPRQGSGHTTASYADGIHASGAAGKLVIENCRFSDLHDDPINIHGTFTRAEQRIDDHTLQLKYIHTQQGGFPQYHVGDKVQFFTRDTLESSDQETEYTVAEVLSNPGEDGNDLRTMVIRFEETVPGYLTQTIGGQPKYVAENVTYTPEVTIRNNTFRDLSARGILCTTRKKTLIENNTFYNTSMATIFLSNDSNEWYESGPIRDLTIRNNTFYITDTGERSWAYRSAIYVHPVTKGGGLPDYTSPIHKNITIEGNTFHMNSDTVVKAESVENLTIRGNKILRTHPDLVFALSQDTLTIQPGASAQAGISLSGRQRTGSTENMYELTRCKNVRISGNTYDNGQKLYASYSGMPADQVQIENDAVSATTVLSGAASAAHAGIVYYSDNPSVASVSADGTITAHAPGSAKIVAASEWNGSLLYSDPLTITVPAAADDVQAPEIDYDSREVLSQSTLSLSLKEAVESVSWSIAKIDGSSAQGAAAISENGQVSFQKNGIYTVTARSAGGSDEVVLIYHSGVSDGMNRGFSVSRQNERLSLDGTSMSIRMETGDLWQTDNSVKNLVLYQPDDSFNIQSFRTAVYVENMPIKESGQWDTASFLLMAGEDNYVSAGKKSHYNGIATVVEKAAVGAETGGSADHNNVTSGWIGFARQGSTISVDFSQDGQSWTHIRDITTDLFDTVNPKIGFAAWHTNDRSKSVSFKNFRISDTAADYPALMQTEPIPFNHAANASPMLSNVRSTSQAPRALEPLELAYDASDADGDAIAQTYVQWDLLAEDGTVLRETTRSLSWTPPKAGTLRATLYAIDAAGSPAAAVTSSDILIAAPAVSGLRSIRVAGIEVWNSQSQSDRVSLRVPYSLGSTQLEADAAGIWNLDGQNQNGPVTLDLNHDQIREISDGTRTVSVEVELAADSQCALQSITLDGQALAKEPVLRFSDQTAARLQIPASSTGDLYVYAENNPVAIEHAAPGQDLDVDLPLQAGISTYLIESRAQDGISREIRTIHVFRTPKSDCAFSSIAINGQALDLASDTLRVDLANDTDSASLQASAAPGATIRIVLDGQSVESENGTLAMLENLKPGRNVLTLLSQAEDGVSRDVRTIVLYVQDSSCADLESVTIGEALFDPETMATHQIVTEDTVAIRARALDSKAIVTITDGFSTMAGQGSVSLDAALRKNRHSVTIQVTSPDGSRTVSKVLDFEKLAYLSDLNWESSSTNGYGTLAKDAANSGSPIKLCQADQIGREYARGIGAHANANVLFQLPAGAYKRLQGAVGVDYVKHNSSYANVTFQIQADGTTVFDSGAMRGTSAQKEFDIDLSGVTSIRLIATQPTNNWDAHADFADCRLLMEFGEETESALDFAELDHQAGLLPDCRFETADPDLLSQWMNRIAQCGPLKASSETAQKDVDTLAAQIQAAREALEGSTADYDLHQLDQAIAKAAAIEPDAFQADEIAALNQALAAARAVRRSPASQAAVNTAASQLNAALMALRRTPDGDALNSLN